MPLRLNAKQLRNLVEQIEAAGGDATELRREVEALGPEIEHGPQTPRSSRLEKEEETTEARLTRRVGYLFPNGIPYDKILEYDYRFGQKELIEQCRKARLAVSGDKKELAAKLIAKGADVKRLPQKRGEVYIARESTGYEEEAGHPALPEGVTFPVHYKEVKAVIDDIGHVTYLYFPSIMIGHIEMVFVKSDYRRRGFGTKLVQFAIDDMRKKGVVKVSASILSKEGAMLLKAHGFSSVNDLMERSI